MEVFYFGDRAALFGAYHPPQGRSVARAGVLLCYPFGYEYVLAHRAYVRLAEQLAQRGFPVLRFDYYGTGDSAGADDAGDPERWVADIAAAINELRGRSAQRALGLVGCRLGGALVARAAEAIGSVRALVLWDAVVRGTDYVAALRAEHRAMLEVAHVAPSQRPPAEPPEALGFALRRELADQLAALQLPAPPTPPAEAALLVQTQGTRPPGDDAALDRLATRIERVVIPAEAPWTWNEDVARVLVPLPVLEAITRWITTELG